MRIRLKGVEAGRGEDETEGRRARKVRMRVKGVEAGRGGMCTLSQAKRNQIYIAFHQEEGCTVSGVGIHKERPTYWWRA